MATFKPFLVHQPGASASGLTSNQFVKGLILAQNERWRRGLGMQVEREPGSNTRGKWRRGSNAWVTYPGVGYSRSNDRVIPSDVFRGHLRMTKDLSPREGPT